jgi:hypothetical protein
VAIGGHYYKLASNPINNLLKKKQVGVKATEGLLMT